MQAVVSLAFVLPDQAGSHEANALTYALTSLTALPLALRRRAPLLVLLAVVAAQFANQAADGPGQQIPYGGLVAVYTVTALSSARIRTAMVVAAIPALIAGVAINSNGLREYFFVFCTFFGAYALGSLARTRQAYTQAVEDRAAQLERANRIESEQATARERARIAREMHDILSHAVSIMIVQAEAGPVAVRAAPARAEAAFEAISDTGREAMTQLRRMLGVLREDGEDGPAAARRTPQPALTELPDLLERVGRSGPRISYETTGTPRPLPLDTEATVYRVVQEALTNVIKHAAAQTVTVLLAYGTDTLEVTVTDDGRGPGTTTGHGLIGIRERAAAHGGTARTGPGPDGRGFRVQVRITSPVEVGS
ncbi:sensor histidine kinase [Streptomyces beijiangensis]|uniref:histidine kinase n=1 Tax=Streptomyces beijiangensis TaxID=163361 RepID=A0A939FAG6_9ACTN|nr:sensor histidine kinase [Streptomyces beijiangensis]